MKLTAKAVAAARYDGRPKKLYDGGGLHLHVTRTARTWRYSYRIDGKAREYTIGPVDAISLAEARERHREARAAVLDGRDPVAARREARQARVEHEERARLAGVKVATLLSDWLERNARRWAPSNTSKVESRLGHVPASFRALPVMQVTPDDVLAVLVAAREATSADLAHRLRGYLRSVFDDALATELVAANPVVHPKVERELGERASKRRYASIGSARLLGDVLAAIDLYAGHRSVRAALQILPHVFTRPTELRAARWEEFEGDQWVVPAERTKMRRELLVPLSRQVRALLEEQRRWTGGGELVFPGTVSASRPITGTTFSVALRRLGFGPDQIVPHGFRHTASTMLNDGIPLAGERVHFHPDAIERQLGHAVGGVRGVYNRAEMIAERRRMMQTWSDYLDTLKSDG